MSMFKLPRARKKQQHVTADANEVLETEVEATDQAATTELETTLSIPKEWKTSDEERYVYAFHNTQSPKLKINQISIYGMELLHNNKGWAATGLIRSTVPKNITFKETTILLLDENEEVLARKSFDLSRLKSIPPNSARPWVFQFTHKDFIKEVEQISDGWTLAFELKRKHQLDLEASWKESITDKTVSSLENVIKNAPELKPGEVNFMGLDAKLMDNGNLNVTILIRNGTDKNINLEQLPLGVKDATQEEVARGGFKLDNFTIKANTSKPWSFIFPKSMIKKDELDLSKWQVYPIQ